MMASTLRVPAKMENLELIARFVQTEAGALGAGPDAAVELLQAVDEAATNVIMHGYRGRPGEIEIDISRQDKAVVVHMRDRAPFFDVTRVPPPDLTLPLEKRRKGGLGVFLMRQFTDEMACCELPGGGNELTMYKVAPAQPE
jgi:serine/threonine-protein kinase RsbW